MKGLVIEMDFETVMRGIRVAVQRHGKTAALVILVSCAPDEQSETMQIAGGTPGSYGSVAHAAPRGDGGSGAESSIPGMPEKASHVSLRIPKSPDLTASNVLVAMLSGQAYPYPYEVQDMGDHLMVTLYVPRGKQTSVVVSPVDQNGELMGDPRQLTIEPQALVGTSDLEFQDIPDVLNFSDNAQQSMLSGDNFLQGLVTTEFLGGEFRQVMHGVYEASEDGVCRVHWQGAEKVYSFLDGPPVCRTGPFEISLKAGQKLGLYPVMDSAEDEITLCVEPVGED